MTDSVWPPLDVSGWTEVQVDGRGKREKHWVLEASGTKWLRKQCLEARPAEAAIEVFALALARHAGVPSAYARPAFWNLAGAERRGIVVRLFLDELTQELSMGSIVLRRSAADYDPANKWAQTPARAREALIAVGDEVGADLVTPFARILFFDAWIGNGDRHQENWGIIRNTTGREWCWHRCSTLLHVLAGSSSKITDCFAILRTSRRTSIDVRVGSEMASSRFACMSSCATCESGPNGKEMSHLGLPRSKGRPYLERASSQASRTLGSPMPGNSSLNTSWKLGWNG